MNNLHCGKKQTGWGRSARQMLLVFVLLLLAIQPGLPADPAASSYDSLRLFTEALSEIAQKYVHPRTDEEMLNGALRGMVNSLDPDSSVLSAKEFKNRGQIELPAEAGVELISKDNLLTAISVLDGSPAAAAGMKPGDHILKIDGQMVRNLTTQEAARKFRGVPGTSLKLQIMRNGALKPIDLVVTMQPLAPGTVTTQVVDGFGYVRLRYFNDDTPRELEKTLKAMEKQSPAVRGLVLDLRNNARGSMEQAVRSTSVLLGDKEIVSARGRAPGSQETFRGKDRDLVFKVPMPTVVLVDQGTARAAEIMASALHDQYQATLLGAKTQGLCGLTKVMPLSDGSALVMTVALCYTPGNLKIQGKGLEPDVQGQTPKVKDKEKEKEKQPAAKTPDQDPWVLQAIDVLKSGKRGQAARQAAS